MSWASLARKAQNIEVDPNQVAKQVVLAPALALDESSEKCDIVDSLNFRGLTSKDLPPFEKGLLVLDTNAFITGLEDYINVADALVTTPQVIQEIRDKTSRDFLSRISGKLTILDPTRESLKVIMDVAEKTGDLGALSRTDFRLCALALDCCKATSCLREAIAPSAPKINPSEFKNNANIETVNEEVSDDEEVAKSDDDGEGEWITESNLRDVQLGTAAGGQMFDGGCACATSDFPMQNTLLHVGVPIVGPRGMRISELRMWLLRCHGCFCIVHDTTRQFCPDCGSGNTLKRVNYVVNEDGEKQLFVNFKRSITKRGTIYNLPKPRGGKKGTNRGLVLREDQLAHIIKGSKSVTVKQNIVEQDDDLSIFGEVNNIKKGDISQPKNHSSYAKYNVNERKKMIAGRKK